MVVSGLVLISGGEALNSADITREVTVVSWNVENRKSLVFTWKFPLEFEHQEWRLELLVNIPAGSVT